MNPNGSVAFEKQDVMVPQGWSPVAVDILAQKYLRRAGVPARLVHVPAEGVPTWLKRGQAEDTPTAGETDSRQVFHRLAGCWAYWGWKGGYFSSQRDAATFKVFTDGGPLHHPAQQLRTRQDRRVPRITRDILCMCTGEGNAQIIFLKAGEMCRTSYADRKGKFQDQSGLTLPFVADNGVDQPHS